MRVFMAGDYELLCKLYGISGASGIMMCCTVHVYTQCSYTCRAALLSMVLYQSAGPPANPPPPLRSLATLARAYSDFMTKGNGDIRIVKNYFNALSQPFFAIPLDQVV